MIDVKGLKKNYGGLQVLKGVDLTIDKGDCVVLVGPSGCGKSTFLRCLTRLEEPDGGEVIFNGKAVTDHDIDHVRQKMGMVFQHFNLFPAPDGEKEHHAGSGQAGPDEAGRS